MRTLGYKEQNMLHIFSMGFNLMKNINKRKHKKEIKIEGWKISISARISKKLNGEKKYNKKKKMGRMEKQGNYHTET